MIEIEAVIQASPETVWQYWTEPKHIVKWAFASNDWEARRAENEIRIDGRFLTEMAAKDSSASFEFSGVYTDVDPGKRLEYTLDDGRKVEVDFIAEDKATRICQRFHPEAENPEDFQRAGWQAILDNFKTYVEENK